MLLAISPARAEFEWQLEGNLEAELRAFPSSRDLPPGYDVNASISIDPILELFFGRDHSITVNPYFRWDQHDGRRTHFDVRQLKWIGVFGKWEVRVGADKVFWGVTESAHLVDIINQDDGVEDIDGEDKLGQPLVSISYQSDIGTFTGIIMPYFRERTFPGRDGRPRLPLHIDPSQTVYGAGNNNWNPDWALRYKHYLGPVDLGLSYFSGLSRDPDFIPGVSQHPDTLGEPVLIPFYDKISQVGLDVQATFGAWLLKLEAINVNPRNAKTYQSLATGIEYTFFQAFGSDADIGVLLEYLWDSRGGAGPNFQESDIFFGLRWEGNDEQTTRVLGGVVFDLDSSAKSVFIEASRRLGDTWRVTLDARFFLDIPPDDPAFIFRQDDFVQLRLARFF